MDFIQKVETATGNELIYNMYYMRIFVNEILKCGLVYLVTEDIVRPSSPVNVLSHPVVNIELEKCVDGGWASKHLKQNSALLALMDQIGVLSDGHCFVEFGAGRGQTSFWISKCIKSSVNSEFILVEHSSLRHKVSWVVKQRDEHI